MLDCGRIDFVKLSWDACIQIKYSIITQTAWAVCYLLCWIWWKSSKLSGSLMSDLYLVYSKIVYLGLVFLFCKLNVVCIKNTLDNRDYSSHLQWCIWKIFKPVSIKISLVWSLESLFNFKVGKAGLACDVEIAIAILWRTCHFTYQPKFKWFCGLI